MDEAIDLIKDISDMKDSVREQAMVPQEDVDRLVREAVEKERVSLKRKIQEHSEFAAIYTLITCSYLLLIHQASAGSASRSPRTVCTCSSARTATSPAGSA